MKIEGLVFHDDNLKLACIDKKALKVGDFVIPVSAVYSDWKKA